MLIISKSKLDDIKIELEKNSTVIDVRKNILPARLAKDSESRRVKQYFLPAIEETFISKQGKITTSKKPKEFTI